MRLNIHQFNRPAAQGLMPPVHQRAHQLAKPAAGLTALGTEYSGQRHKLIPQGFYGLLTNRGTTKQVNKISGLSKERTTFKRDEIELKTY
jgi:hypothetical protein